MMTLPEKTQHWQQVYTTKGRQEVSWYQAVPQTSIDLIMPLGVDKNLPVIDIGSGDSALVDWLLAEGYEQVHALDISAAALERLQQRLPGPLAARLHTHATDVLHHNPQQPYALWHDRAVFHFLTQPEEVAAYIALVSRSAQPGGYLVLGTFAPEGPQKCSGLPVSRYSAAELAALFVEDFAPVRELSVTHPTPFGTTQAFTFAVMQRNL